MNTEKIKNYINSEREKHARDLDKYLRFVLGSDADKIPPATLTKFENEVQKIALEIRREIRKPEEQETVICTDCKYEIDFDEYSEYKKSHGLSNRCPKCDKKDTMELKKSGI